MSISREEYETEGLDNGIRNGDRLTLLIGLGDEIGNHEWQDRVFHDWNVNNESQVNSRGKNKQSSPRLSTKQCFLPQ